MSDSVQPHRRQPTRLRRPWDSPGKKTGMGCHFLLQGMKVKSESEVAQSCPTLSDPMECSLPGSSIHGIFQARVLEWGAIAFSNLPLYSHQSIVNSRILWRRRVWIDRCIASLLGTTHVSQPQRWTDYWNQDSERHEPCPGLDKGESTTMLETQFCVLSKVTSVP